MTETDRETETALAAETPAEMPLPTDPKVIFLGGLFALALLATAYVAGEIVLPMVFAITLKLLLQPIVRLFERLHLPRVLAALLIYHCPIRNDRRPGHGNFGPRWQLGGQASRRHSPARGASQFRASAHQYGATVSATNREFWDKRDAARHSWFLNGPSASGDAFCGHTELR
jgi:hypothetical protein